MHPARILQGSQAPVRRAARKSRHETNARPRKRRVRAGGAPFRRDIAGRTRRMALPKFAVRIAQPSPTMMFSFSRSFRDLARATRRLANTCRRCAAHLKRATRKIQFRPVVHASPSGGSCLHAQTSQAEACASNCVEAVPKAGGNGTGGIVAEKYPTIKT